MARFTLVATIHEQENRETAMISRLVQQAFRDYDPEEASAEEKAKFCIYCGGDLGEELKGGRHRPTCGNCGWTYFKNPSPGVALLIEQDGKILIGKRARGGFGAGAWCLPGGFVEDDEDYLTTARREALEETGLEVDLDSILNVTANFLSPRLHTIAVVILAHPRTENIEAGDDITELRWLAHVEPCPDMAFAADAYIVEQFRNHSLPRLPLESV